MLNSINRFFLEKHHSNPISINCGHCYHWAMIAFVVTGKKGKLVTIKNCGGHAFLYKDGKYFDSQTLHGVEDWKELPFFNHYNYLTETKAHYQEPKEFKQYWSQYGANYWSEKIINDGIESCKNHSQE